MIDVTWYNKGAYALHQRGGVHLGVKNFKDDHNKFRAVILFGHTHEN